jgi:plasmid stabilization system protein ParE
MAKVKLTANVLTKLEQIEFYYVGQGEVVAKRAISTIFAALNRVSNHPLSGRPQQSLAHPNYPDLREVVIPFGATGFVALYRIDAETDSIVVLALKHQREEKYKGV